MGAGPVADEGADVTDLQIAAAYEAAEWVHAEAHAGRLHIDGTPLAALVEALGPYERDGMDDADDQQAAWKDES